MRRGMRNALIVGGLVLVLGVVNVAIAGKERLIARGATIFVELAPVDPRSLIQGDYMRLDYELVRVLRSLGRLPRDGRLVVRLDSDGIAYFSRLHREGAALAPGEHLLHYRTRGGQVRIGSDAYFFQEGHAARYQEARFGELRVAPNGSSVLVGLRDGQLRPIE